MFVVSTRREPRTFQRLKFFKDFQFIQLFQFEINLPRQKIFSRIFKDWIFLLCNGSQGYKSEAGLRQDQDSGFDNDHLRCWSPASRSLRSCQEPLPYSDKMRSSRITVVQYLHIYQSIVLNCSSEVSCFFCVSVYVDKSHSKLV